MAINSAGNKLEKRICPNPDCGKKFECPRTAPKEKTCSRQCGYTMRERRANASSANLAGDGPQVGEHQATSLDQQVLNIIKGRKATTIDDLSNVLDRGLGSVQASIKHLKDMGYNVALSETKRGGIILEPILPSHEPHKITHDLSEYEGQWVRFGVAGDKHMANMHSRLDVMKLLYDMFESEGITTVYDTGNWIDGEARFNKSELLVHGMDAQIDYWIENHPERKGITTRFVAGDDHEGWYQQRESIEIGRYAMLRAKDAGREDLEYLGYAEALIELKASEGSRMMMVNHPGGGASYAISYKGQKYVEMLQGGEKPAIVLQGHYHKFNIGYPREVWVVDTGTCCDQTLFMRKRQLQAHVGGQIIELMQAPDGRIVRFRAEFLPFYDKGFYEKNRRYFGVPTKLRPKQA